MRIVICLALSLYVFVSCQQPVTDDCCNKATLTSTLDARQLWRNADPAADYFNAVAAPGDPTFADNYSGPVQDIATHLQNMFDKIHNLEPLASQNPGFIDDDDMSFSLANYPSL